MADCFYYKKGKRFDNTGDLIHAFYKDNNILKNAAIFSSEEIQESTIKKLRAIPGINKYNSENSDKSYSEGDGLKRTHENVEGKETKNEISDVLDFIVTPHVDLFNELNIVTESNRLVPEYIKENRIYNYVLDSQEELERVSEKVDVSNLAYDKENLANLRKHSDLDTISDNKLIYSLSKIEAKMEFEEKTKSFGTLLHNVVSIKIRGSNPSGIINTFLSDPNHAEIFGDYPKEDWEKRIDDITNEIISVVKKTGIPLTEMFLTSHIVKGKLDLVVVDQSGDAHIFEIKVSNTKYKDWDSAKILQLDWQLALYRQLLGQHINVDKTLLYVIPIYMNGLGNPNNVAVEDFSNRTGMQKSGLNEKGRIYERANAILPRKVVVDYNPEREGKLKEKLNDLLPSYTIQTDVEDYDVERIMKSARKRFEEKGTWSKWNNYEDVPGLKKGYMEGDTEEEFRDKIEKYVAFVKSQSNREVTLLKNAMISSIKTGVPLATSRSKKDKDVTLNHLIVEFFNDEWDIVDSIPEAVPMGLIILKNKINGNINVISITTHAFLQNSQIAEGKLSGDLEYYKVFLFVNEFRDQLFPGGRGKLGQVIAYNSIANKSYSQNVFSKYKEFKDLMYKRDMQSDLKLKEDDISGIEDIALYNLNTGLRNLNLSVDEEKRVKGIFNLTDNTNLDALDVEKLIDIQKTFYDEFPGYKDKTFTTGINFNDNKEVLLALLNVLIATKSKMVLHEDSYGMSKWSLGFSDFKSLFAALYTKDQAKYDKEGKKIQGIVRGLIWTTPDWVDSLDIKMINRMVSTSISHLGERMVRVSNRIHIETNEYYKAINFSDTERSIIGETQSKHFNMWRQVGNKVDPRFITKNPYQEDLENALTDAERKYLKKMLLIMNAFKLNISDTEIQKVDSDSLDSLKRNPKIAKAIESGDYFEMPLVRREELTKYQGAWKKTGQFVKSIPNYAIEFKDYIDSRELQQEDLNSAALQSQGYYEMYDVYGRQTKEHKAKIIEKHGVDYFELNLDTLAHRLAFNKIRKRSFDKILPIINAYVWWMKLASGKAGQDITKQLESIENQLKLAVFDETIIDDEFKDISIVEGAIKSIATPAMLGFKATTIVKEMTLGVFKGISIAASQIYGKDQFTIKDLAKAYHKMITIDKKFSNEFNLINELNHFYRFANMDANSISKKLQSDRKGILKGVSRYLYACNTAGDYPNRLSIFLAKMIHDGSYDAHTFENGIFKYDPRKDERFSYYLANRNKYKQGDNYIPAKNDEKYNSQRRRYLLLISQLQEEYRGEENFTEDTIVDKAYSATERNSLKTMTDMSYGYYDKDATSQINNTWFGLTFLQFMQFWPGKMTQWFANPTKTSPMGRCIQEYEELANGEKALVWRKPVLDSEGEFIYEGGEMKFEKTTENTGDPSLIWEATPYEGLAYSLLYTAQDLYHLDFKGAFKDEDRNHRLLFALSDGAMMFALFSLIYALFEGLLEDNGGEEGMTTTTLNMMSAISKKILNEQNVYQSTIGAINTTPVFLSWSKKFGGDVIDVFKGEKDLLDLMERNVGAAEPLKWQD